MMIYKVPGEKKIKFLKMEDHLGLLWQILEGLADNLFNVIIF